MNCKRKLKHRFLLMRTSTPPISSEFQGGGGLNTPKPPLGTPLLYTDMKRLGCEGNHTSHLALRLKKKCITMILPARLCLPGSIQNKLYFCFTDERKTTVGVSTYCRYTNVVCSLHLLHIQPLLTQTNNAKRTNHT